MADQISEIDVQPEQRAPHSEAQQVPTTVINPSQQAQPRMTEWLDTLRQMKIKANGIESLELSLEFPGYCDVTVSSENPFGASENIIVYSGVKVSHPLAVHLNLHRINSLWKPTLSLERQHGKHVMPMRIKERTRLLPSCPDQEFTVVTSRFTGKGPFTKARSKASKKA
jgi:hypothetical protein